MLSCAWCCMHANCHAAIVFLDFRSFFCSTQSDCMHWIDSVRLVAANISVDLVEVWAVLRAQEQRFRLV